MRFWDSSALVPLVIRQRASAAADGWFGEDSAVALWALTPVEITSALWRHVREGAVAEDDALRAETRVDELVLSSYVVADLDTVSARGRRLLRVHALRAADASQLAAAILWAANAPQGRVFHTLDDRLAFAARREGFSVP
jgi:predicted nucleic acid-binding protein